jgi:lipopolysaccharide export system protein LptA
LKRALWTAVLGLVLGACAKPTLSPRPSASVAVASVPSPTPEPTPSYPQAKPLDQALPVKVRSKRLKVGQGGAETVFYGGVTVTQDSTVLTARELRSHDEGRNAVADGDVRLLDPLRKVEALADEADYGDALREATLRGKVRLMSVDPYGLGVTMTGQSASYLAVSRSASAQGGVTVYRGQLTATADSAEMADGGAFVHLSGSVLAIMGLNEACSQEADMEEADRSLTLRGSVRARFIPSDMRKAAADPAGVK